MLPSDYFVLTFHVMLYSHHPRTFNDLEETFTSKIECDVTFRLSKGIDRY